jgi:hypothetical protein
MKLTLKEATEQGYEHYLYAGEQFQSLQDLAFIEDSDFDKGKIELVNREPYHPSSGMDAESILDMIAEQVWLNHHDESGDDTSSVNDAIRELPKELFDPILKAMQDKLNTLNYYKSSGIELIKD